MKQIRTLSLKFWFPVSLLAMSSCAIVIAALINIYLGVNQQVESAQEFVQYDMASLSRDIEENIENGTPEQVEDSLQALNVNTKYRGLFIVRLTDFSIWSHSSYVDIAQPSFELSKHDRTVIERFRTNSTALVEYDPSDKVINAYFSVPTREKNRILIRDGVLIARYYVGLELKNLFHKSIRNNIYFIALFLILIGIIQAFYYRFIRFPVSRLISSVKEFAKRPQLITPNLTGRSEFTDIANALHDMSAVILKQNLETNAAQHQAQQGAQLLESVFKALPDLFFLVDAQMKIVDYRASEEESLYMPPDAFIGQPIKDVLPENVATATIENIELVHKTGNIVTYEYEMPAHQDSLSVRHFEARVAQVPGTDKIMVIVRDITEQRESELLIEKQAFYDALTDLPNRYLAMDRLNQFILDARRYDYRIAVLFLDLDDFKKINDTLGHIMGDQVLIETANRLVGAIRKTDTIARLGGDEFVILFNKITGDDDLQQVVNKVARVLDSPYRMESSDLLISASMGIAIYPDDSEDANVLLRNADMAMYHSKALGKNQYSFFTAEMNNKISRRLLLEQHMLEGLSNNEFEVYYQPQFDLSAQKLIGAEALLRWNSKMLGAVSPGEFIPIAEQNGRIIELGYFVIEQAIKQVTSWPIQRYPNFRVAINLSPRQMRDTEVLTFVEQQLRQNQLSGHHLEFEITEGVLLTGQPQVPEILNGFHKLDITLSMDDFGTGYSSLSYLQEYPFDLVKIDRSFVNKIVESSHSRKLINAIIGMTHNLNLKVIAEGVETVEQALLLKQFGCDFIQGYLMGRPLPFEKFCQRWHEPDLAKKILSMPNPEQKKIR
ncbi:MAG: EAL domain-containing protein [Reinekea sp.]